jgi:hypothetical protein
MTMFGNDFSRIYHYHLRKCGGTTLNEWLSRHVADTRFLDKATEDATIQRFVPEWELSAADEAGAFAAWLRTLSECYEVLCSHIPMRSAMHQAACSITVLRNPMDRIASQVADLRRLKPHDLDRLSGPVREFVTDAKNMPFREFLEKHARVGYGRKWLDNYEVRALAASRIGYAAFAVESAESVLAAALRALEEDFQIVGLQERLEETGRAIAARLGLPPDCGRPALNVTRSVTTMRAEMEHAMELLRPLTEHDLVLYRRAVELFEERHAVDAMGYSASLFEERHAEHAVQRLKPILVGDDVVFSVRMPLIGSGFHGRDASGTEQCRVWSGPQTRAVLYMPVPPGQKITVKLWVHGYASPRQRDLLRVTLDGTPVEHRFEEAPGYLEAVAAEFETTRPFVSLAVEVHQTLSSEESGESGHDVRQRGFSFDRYGWRIAN